MKSKPMRSLTPDRPERHSIFSIHLPRDLWRWFEFLRSSLTWLFLHTISANSSQSSRQADFYAGLGDSPEGTAFEAEGSEAISYHIYLHEEERRRVLEEKASNLLNIILAFTPLVMAGAAVAIGFPKHGWEVIATILLLALAIASLLVALVAGLRAIRVKGSYGLWLDTFVDRDKKQFRRFDRQRYTRGIVWCGLMNAGLNDHIADYVRAAQYFLVVSVVGTALATMLVLPRTFASVSKDKDVSRIACGCSAKRAHSTTREESIWRPDTTRRLLIIPIDSQKYVLPESNDCIDSANEQEN